MLFERNWIFKTSPILIDFDARTENVLQETKTKCKLDSSDDKEID